ncbi:hypothetical protein NDK43_10410 [Neobacillus pocheonensis]|uniref:Uncharacterized protein n=1 Tax=Neobacillus pocheonensis TaxID=363869 RepID=A0ABT0WAW6_9BACI|nr:hypothetical protein [Neobacillus pocheonensis]
MKIRVLLKTTVNPKTAFTRKNGLEKTFSHSLIVFYCGFFGELFMISGKISSAIYSFAPNK